MRIVSICCFFPINACSTLRKSVEEDVYSYKHLVEDVKNGTGHNDVKNYLLKNNDLDGFKSKITRPIIKSCYLESKCLTFSSYFAYWK